MRKISPPTVDDYSIIDEISENKRLKSYPYLITAVAALKVGYTQYRAGCGNARYVPSVALLPDQREFLKGLYDSRANSLAYIPKLRRQSEPYPCPMCGSLGCGTMDHIFPQADYPEYAIYSLNIVPACSCNSKRKNVLRGDPGERILHPYFDACLADRLIVARISNFGQAPSISLDLKIPHNDPQYAAIAFHVEKVVKRTAICGYLERKWAAMCEEPSLVIRDLGVIMPGTPADLAQLLETELGRLDKFHKGKNSWDSIFVAGLLDPTVLQPLFHQLTRPGRAIDGPLF